MTEIRFNVTALDCLDPLELAAFYAQLTGLEVEPLGDFPAEDVVWIELLNEGKPTLGFQKVETFVAPTWPEGPVPQQLHVDFAVSDSTPPKRTRSPWGQLKRIFNLVRRFESSLIPQDIRSVSYLSSDARRDSYVNFESTSIAVLKFRINLDRDEVVSFVSWNTGSLCNFAALGISRCADSFLARNPSQCLLRSSHITALGSSLVS